MLAVHDEICGENEEYQNCGIDCERACVHVGTPQIICNHMCSVGCFCINGYVRQNDEDGPCVKEVEC